MSGIVLGWGPSGVRAAAALGEGALLLDPSNSPGGREHPEIPEDLGCAPVQTAEAVAKFYGEAPQVSGEARRALWVGGRLVELPLSRLRLKEILPEGEYLRSLGDQAKARAKVILRHFVGGGAEERTYRDWVVQRYGHLTYESLHAPYARNRWGDPDALNVSLARLHHAAIEETLRVALGASPRAGWEALCAGIQCELGVEVESLEVVDGRVGLLRTARGSRVVDGLYCACPVAQVLAWLGDELEAGLRWDVSRLPHRHRVQVAFPVIGGEEVTCALPEEIHVVHADAPFFRVTRPDALPGGGELAGWLVAHLSMGPSDRRWSLAAGDLCAVVAEGLASLGLHVFEGEGRVERFRAYDPGWIGPWHPVQIRVLAALEALGITMVGRVGGYRWLDPGRELAVGMALGRDGAPMPREIFRVLADPPVRALDEDTSLDAFVTG